MLEELPMSIFKLSRDKISQNTYPYNEHWILDSNFQLKSWRHVLRFKWIPLVVFIKDRCYRQNFNQEFYIIVKDQLTSYYVCSWSHVSNFNQYFSKFKKGHNSVKIFDRVMGLGHWPLNMISKACIKLQINILNG